MINSKRNITFIVNPISGTRSKDAICDLIDEMIDASRFDCRIIRTEYAGHASVIASQCVSEGCDI